jgi:hypothetical protein
MRIENYPAIDPSLQISLGLHQNDENRELIHSVFRVTIQQLIPVVNRKNRGIVRPKVFGSSKLGQLERPKKEKNSAYGTVTTALTCCQGSPTSGSSTQARSDEISRTAATWPIPSSSASYLA